MRYTFGGFQRFAMSFAVIGLLFLLPVSGSLRQSEKKTKREDFGSSLHHLNEKPKKKQADKKASLGADDEIRLNTSLAVFDVLVLNKEGKSITGFKKDDFIVTEDGIKQDISELTLGDGTAVPRSIILILDYSGSQFPYIKTSTDAAKILVDSLGPKDKMALVTDDVDLLVDFTNDKTELKNVLQGLEAQASSETKFGKSLQFSALMATLKELLNEDEQSVIIFQTDGDELLWLRGKGFQRLTGILLGTAAFSIEDLYSAVENSHVTIYSVIPGLQLIGLEDKKLIEQFKIITDQEMLAVKERNPADYEAWLKFRAKHNDKFFIKYAKELLEQHLALDSIAKLSGGWTEYLPTPDKAQ